MSNPIPALCNRCGAEIDVAPPNLPPSGGTLAARDDPVRGWTVESFVCGACWDRRPRTWTCVPCGGSGPVWSNFCSRCHSVRPDPLPHFVDWDLLAKEQRERQREAEALIAEWDREYPGWRLSLGRTSQRI